MEGGKASQMISVAEFLSVGINLAELSGNIIRDIWRSNDIGRKDKEND
jgi:hypothetical protein